MAIDTLTAAVRETDVVRSDVRGVVGKFWGFDRLRPLQAQAIEAGTTGRDSLVVLPTGGGKSLCYQVPPLLTGRTDVVVSPLIALMKDQVDGLQARGYPAAALHSGMDGAEQRRAERDLVAGDLRLLFVAPERLLAAGFMSLLRRARVAAFAIDEAHCISHWGHDFRPEYRRLATLRDAFPDASLHAFTATATPRVRDDIAQQLCLREPTLLVGCFDRPNLVYRILPQVDLRRQIVQIVRRHEGEAVIIYCLSRKDTESTAEMLEANGIQAAHYHAGLDADQRRATQNAFAAERLNVVVATVAFGMGIDRSNVRCVLHATMPRSVEHYQQETGRAGRDGLEAECVLLYSGADVMRWQGLLERDTDRTPELVEAQNQMLRQMQGICAGAVCRHKALSQHFGQAYEAETCGACDMCLGEVEGVEDATVLAQKVLSCVARVGQRFGVMHVVDVLRGADTAQVRRCGHDRLSTFGLVSDLSRPALTAMVYQLIDQGLLRRTEGDRPMLQLNDASWSALRGERRVQLLRPREQAPAATDVEREAWEGVDAGLFEHLRQLRRTWATERGVPPYVVFEDSTLRELARVRPTDQSVLSAVRGIGEKRMADYGSALTATIAAYCAEHDLQSDLRPEPAFVEPEPRRRGGKLDEAVELFEQRKSIAQVMAATERAESTVFAYLAEWIRRDAPASIDTWVDDATYARVAAVLEANAGPRLRPVFEQLNGAIDYGRIRLVATHLRATLGGDGPVPEAAGPASAGADRP